MIFNVSPHRSATRSVTAFAEAHGLKAKHWLGPEFDAAAETTKDLWELAKPHAIGSDILSDLPWPMLYRQASRCFPNAKFLLITRNPSNWVASVRRHAGDRDFSHLERLFYKHLVDRTVAGVRDLRDSDMAAGYQHHVSEVVSTVGSRLSLILLSDRDVSLKLAGVLGVKLKCPLTRVSD